MDWNFFLKGLAIGFAIAVPVGPIGLLCVDRTLNRGALSGLVSGLGAASADAVYGSVAALGLTAVSGWLVDHQFLLGLVGGGLLIVLGLKALRRREETAARVDKASRTGLVGDYGSTFVLTLTNPMTILAFSAIFAGLGLVGADSGLAAGCLIAGVFVGSGLWWVILSGGVGLVRHRLSPGVLQWINRLAGLILIGFGLALWLRQVWAALP